MTLPPTGSPRAVPPKLGMVTSVNAALISIDYNGVAGDSSGRMEICQQLFWK